jgi:hypothetical protein
MLLGIGLRTAPMDWTLIGRTSPNVTQLRLTPTTL